MEDGNPDDVLPELLAMLETDDALARFLDPDQRAEVDAALNEEEGVFPDPELCVEYHEWLAQVEYQMRTYFSHDEEFALQFDRDHLEAIEEVNKGLLRSRFTSAEVQELDAELNRKEGLVGPPVPDIASLNDFPEVLCS